MNGNTRFTDYDAMLSLLRIYSMSDRPLHIGNVLGAPNRIGDIERQLTPDSDFTIEERAQARRCARELEVACLIVPTYGDLSSPEEWMVITDAGRKALERGAVDELDAALWRLSPTFVEMRRGAWRAANGGLADTQRQAAHSGRELVNQVLHAIAPDEELLAQRDDKSPLADRPTRRDRYRLAVQKRGRGSSKTDVEVIEKAVDLMEAQRRKLDSSAHSRERIDPETVKDALLTIDMVLRLLLV